MELFFLFADKAEAVASCIFLLLTEQEGIFFLDRIFRPSTIFLITAV